MKKKLFAIIMSVMLMVTFIPCIAFADDADPGDIDLVNAHVSGVINMAGSKEAFNSADGVCQPTIYDSSKSSQWDMLLEYVELKIEGKSGRIETLKQNEDFTVSYENNHANGEATIIFTAVPKSGFTGSVSEVFEIDKFDQARIQAEFSSKTFTLGETAQLSIREPDHVNGINVGFDPNKGCVTTNSGSMQAIYEGTHTIDDGLTEPVTYYDYYITASKAGTYKLKIKCPGDETYYEKTASYTITVKPKVQKIKIAKLNGGKQYYNGKAKKPVPVVKSGSKTLKKGKDYTVSYKNNVKASDSAVVIVKAKGSKYTGTVERYFTIYKGKQTIDVKVNSTTLEPGGKVTYIKQTAATKTRNVGVFSYKSSNNAVVKVKRDANHNCVVTSVGKGTATVTITADKTDNLKSATKKITFTVQDGSKKTTINKNMVLFTLANGTRVTDISKYTFKKGQYPDVTLFPNKAKRDQALKDGKMTGKLIFKTDWSFSYDTKAKTLTIWGAGDKYVGVLTYKYNTTKK